MQLDLKPCPFCGGADLKYWCESITCENCDAVGPDAPAQSDEKQSKAAEVWNRRTTRYISRGEEFEPRYGPDREGEDIPAALYYLNELERWKPNTQNYRDSLRLLRASIEGTPSLAALKAQEPDKWQLIDTAPKHGDCLVFGGRHKAVTILPADGDWWREMQKEGSIAVPTHWQPLPAPPSLPTTAGGGHDT